MLESTRAVKPTSTIVIGTYHDDDDVDNDDDDDALSCQFKFTANSNHVHNADQGSNSCSNSINRLTTDPYSLMKSKLERLMKEQEEQFKLRHKYSELVRQVERKQLRAEERERLFDNAVIDDDDDDDDDQSDYDYNSDSDDGDDDDLVDEDDDDGKVKTADLSSLPHSSGVTVGMNVSVPRPSLPALSSSMYSSKAVSDGASRAACTCSGSVTGTKRETWTAGQLGLRRSKPIPIPHAGSTCRLSSGNLSTVAPSTAMCDSYQLTPHAAAHRLAGL